jgi:hypothetical protein
MAARHAEPAAGGEVKVRGDSAGHTGVLVRRAGAARRAAGMAASAGLLLLTAVGPSHAQPPGAPDAAAGLASLSVPGGTAVLARVAGVDTATPRGIILLQIIRAVHEAPAGSDPARDERVRRFRAYLADVSDYLRASRAFRGGRLDARQASARESRRALADLAGAVGADLAERGGVHRLVAREDDEAQRRRRHLQEAGVGVAALVEDFNAGGTASLAMPGDEVPLPLDAGAWAGIIGGADEGSGSLLMALVGDRRASLLYYGLMSLDAPTRAYVGAHRSLLEALLEGNRPAIFASLARGIRVRGGSIDVPGGAEAAAAWEVLLGRRTAEPEPFILELLDRSGGRAALLYDAIDHLDPPRRAFALGLNAPDPGANAEHLRELLAACLPSLAGWDPEIRPFRRVAFDPVHLLTATRVLPSGQLPAPAGRRFWSAVLSGTEVPDEPQRMLVAGEPDVAITAVWLVQQVCVTDPVRRQQLLKVWQFGQRAFAGAAPAALAQALVALRGFARFPMLLLTLERMGIRDPATCAGVVRHAQRLSEIGDDDRAASALRQFQGALSVLERIRFNRARSAEAVLELVGSLTAVPLTPDGEYRGGVARWIESRLLPALDPVTEARAAAAGTAVSAEATLLAAMAGALSGAVVPDVAWEGLPYRVDVGAAEFGRLVQVRQKQGGRGLDAVLGFCREAARLQGSLKSPADVAARVSALNDAVEALRPRSPSYLGESETGPDLRKLTDEAVGDLRKITSPGDVAKAGRIAAPLERAGDALLGDVLASIAYAPHLGDPAGPELLAGDPSARHSFGFDERVRDVRIGNPWRLPQRVLGVAGGWRVSGSMLGLDVGLAALAVRRLETDGLPPPPGGNDIDRATLASAVSLCNPFATSDTERDTLIDATRRGRALMTGLASHPAALPDLVRAAGLNEWWRQAVLWEQAHEPGRVVEYFSRADLVRIGEAATTPLPPLDTWGAASLDTDGCLCLRFPGAGARETLAGRMGTALVAEQFVDLALWVAESLADLGLPAQLSRSILALATQDVLEAYRPAYIDDWSAMIAAVRSLPRDRFVDYVAALTAGGPLVPDDREHVGDVRR